MYSNCARSFNGWTPFLFGTPREISDQIREIDGRSMYSIKLVPFIPPLFGDPKSTFFSVLFCSLFQLVVNLSRRMKRIKIKYSRIDLLGIYSQ